MSGGLDRLVRVFVAPAHDDAPPSVRAHVAAPRVPKRSRASGGSLLRRRRTPTEQQAPLTRFVPSAVAQPGHFEETDLPGRAGHGTATGVAARPADPCVGVLCRPGDAAALGTVVALALLRGSPARSGLVCVWPAAALSSRRPSVPVRPAARRLQAALAARDLEARAAGPLAVALLPPDPEAAALAARRAAAVARGPVVHVVAGARPAALTPLLHDADRVLVAGTEGDAVCALALTGLAAEGLDARCVPAPDPGAPRALAAAGLAVPPSTRAALAAALEGLT
jgi:hypothetical protein